MCCFGIILIADLEQNADLAAEVDIGINNTLNAVETADGDFLTDLGDCGINSSVNGHILILDIGLSHHLFNGCGIELCNLLRKGTDEVFEIVGLCNEVGLAVDLDDDANAALLADKAIYDALCCNTGCFLCGCRKALLTKIIHCLIHIAVAFLESLFAVHHACTGHLAKLHYVFCGEFHYNILRFIESLN